jgi:hypothetical protein
MLMARVNEKPSFQVLLEGGELGYVLSHAIARGLR